MKLYWDLDGVLRNQNISGVYPTEWNTEIEGYSLVEYYSKFPEKILELKPTEYIQVFFEFKAPIISSQPEIWRPYTDKWIEKYLGDDVDITYVNNIEEKLRYIRSSKTYLIEDYPFFTGEKSKQIILIDRPYNKKGNCGWRIYLPDTLRSLLKYLKNQK